MEKDKLNGWMQLGKTLFEVGKTTTNLVGVPAIFEKIFGHHIDTPIALSYFIEDFPNLNRTQYIFKSNAKQKLTGYMYSYKNVEQKAIIVLAHGFGGGGQRTYMDVINELASRGFYVFAYDATGNDESEGIIGGFPQAVIDLERAIKYVRSLKEYKNYPICLFGHSMGAYAVSTVLNFVKDIKAVVACSGFNRSSEIVKQQALKYMGNAEETAIYINNYERLRFGRYAKYTAIDGFKKTNANIMVVHSQDDSVIPITAGFGTYQKIFKNNSRFTFVKFNKTGHGTVYYKTQGAEYAQAYVANYKKFISKKNLTEDEKAKFAIENLDRTKWTNLINKKLFDKIEKFYKDSI